MSFSLYYDARRDYPLTEEERDECNRFIDLFCDKFPFKDEAEEFSVYPGDDEKSVFYGSTKLPDSSQVALLGALQHWTSLLYEIHRIIDDCEWTVTVDDDEMIWTEDGWLFPDNEDESE